MREIKFRGKCRADGEWIYGYLSGPDTINVIVQYQANESDTSTGHCDEFEIDPKTVGEFTGLHDKNRKEIYEGDILKSGNGRAWTVFYGRYFRQELGGRVYGIGWHLKPNDIHADSIELVVSSYEVIGNINQ